MRESLPCREAGNRFLLEFVLVQTVRPRTANVEPRESHRPFFALVAPIILSSVESLSWFLPPAANKHRAKLVESYETGGKRSEVSEKADVRRRATEDGFASRFPSRWNRSYRPCSFAFAFSSRIEARRNAPRENRVETRRTAQGRASVTERGVGDGGANFNDSRCTWSCGDPLPA